MSPLLTRRHPIVYVPENEKILFNEGHFSGIRSGHSLHSRRRTFFELSFLKINTFQVPLRKLPGEYMSILNRNRIMNIGEKFFLIIVGCIVAASAHGMNWSKVYVSKENNRLLVRLHINEGHIARIPSVKDNDQPVDDLPENGRSFITSEVWKGITVRVDDRIPGTLVDEGYTVSEREAAPSSGAFHSHGRTVLLTRTWTVPDTATRVEIAFHLFSADATPMKWLVLAGAPEKWKNRIVYPGSTVEFNFRENEFTDENIPKKRYIPLWIALGISIAIAAGAAVIYFFRTKGAKSSP